AGSVGAVARQRGLDLPDDPLDGLGARLAAVVVVPVAPLDRLEGAGRGAAGGGRPAQRAVVEDHLGFEGRVAPGVQDLPGEDRFDGTHGITPDGWRFRLRSLIEPSGPGAPATPTPVNGTRP